MKNLEIPYIGVLESMPDEERLKAMELFGAKGAADNAGWPEEWPYRPSAVFSVARGDSCLFILFHVRGLDLRAAALEDNGPVWEDSCCEFFVEHPSDGTYYNFEMNCIGTLLASKRKSRNEFTAFDHDRLKKILRYSSLERKAYDISDKIVSWEAGMGIPFSLIGMDPGCLPEKIRANFYKCGDKTAHPHFLSWAPIDTPAPDFHRPEFFGELTIR
ncbi:MAG: hypothetical protein IAB78_00980 [Bacteroidetes bacterium]|uniref:Carbohydrate-binding domain-containing protein n=1 Tax=Candidatus Cryptobacteroides excrementavium TaxID=2840759 RepID=A0A9D9NRE7_9BACT|nr:hypothetical protein [Candidatus Cryptobacteroides excrementavium]